MLKKSPDFMWLKETRILFISSPRDQNGKQIILCNYPDPDPRINASDWWIRIRMRIRILLFSSLAFKMQKKLSKKKEFSAYYSLKVLLHNFSKIKSQKEITLGDRRIRIWIQKHSDPTDPDPQDW